MNPELRPPTANHISTFATSPKRTRKQWCSCALALAIMLGLAAVPRLAEAQTLTILHSFSDPEGAFPDTGLIRDAAGNLYGTASGGGVFACDENLGGGTVFKVDPSGKTIRLHAFANGLDGCIPTSGLIHDLAGNLYGTNLNVLYKINAAGKLTVLHRFAVGSYPTGSLLRDGQGNLYGVTSQGGKFSLGTVYKLDASGKQTILHSFGSGSDGLYPAGGLVRDAAGNLYGTTVHGGVNPCNGGIGCGTVFRLEMSGRETVFYSFTGGEDGESPNGGLIRDAQGNFYGTTTRGGDPSCDVGFGCGTVFKLDRTGKLTVLHSFLDGEGAVSRGGLIRDSSGNLYGTTFNGGGTCNCGSVFKVDTASNLTLLHIFGDNPDGAGPDGGLVRDAAGNLYGTTFIGGVDGLGTVFKLTP